MSGKFETPEKKIPKSRGDLVQDEDTSRTNKSLTTNQTLNDSMLSSIRRESLAASKEKVLAKIRSQLENCVEENEETKTYDKVRAKDSHNYNIFHRAALDHNLGLIREVDIDDMRIREMLGEPNTFGDTPLNLACMKWRRN